MLAWYMYRLIFGSSLGMLAMLFCLRWFEVELGFVILLNLAALLTFLVWPRSHLLLFVTIGLGLGWLRADDMLTSIKSFEQMTGQKVTVQGTISTDPVYHESGQMDFMMTKLSVEGDEYPVTVSVRGFVNDVRRGDRVVAGATLRDGFASWQGSLYFAEIEVIDRDESALARFRRRFVAIVQSILPGESGSLGLGFLLGTRSSLSEEFKDQLSNTGLTHIIAVSGYNLTILVLGARHVTSRASRFQGLVLSSLLLVVFIGLTGLSPSLTRASIVSVLSLVAWYFARPIRATELLLYSSSLSALLRPQYVWYELGWYLSLLAFIGVLMVAPAIKRRLYGEREPKFIAGLLIETGSAQLMTLPLIALVFSELSAISLLANGLVLPLVPLCMLLCASVGLLGFISFQVAALVAVPTYLLLNSMTAVIDWLARMPWSLIRIEITAQQMIITYGVLIATILLVVRRSPSNQPLQHTYD